MDAFEIAIVGGGPAGLATALFLAHANPALTDRIVVLEKQRYPREKPCGGAIGGRADVLLATIGVRVDVPSAEVGGLSIVTSGANLLERRSAIGRVVRRLEYDHELARIARARGIRIDEGAGLTKLALEDAGVVLETARASVRARAVVGADGVGSFVRRAAGLNARALTAQVIELDTEPVRSDPASDLLHFDFTDRGLSGYSWDFPTLVEGRPRVCRGTYCLRLGQEDVDLLEVLGRRLAERGLDITRYPLKRYAERGFEPAAAYSIPRVLLVGEAAGIDPLTGEGIPQALEYGALAGSYLAEKLAQGDLSFDDWTARVRRASFGADLRARRYIALKLYGRRRAWIERHLDLMPEYIGCGLEQFAGRRVAPLRWWQATGLAAFRFARAAIRRGGVAP